MSQKYYQCSLYFRQALNIKVKSQSDTALTLRYFVYLRLRYRGGVLLTVNGRDLDSVKYPLMRVKCKYMDTETMENSTWWTNYTVSTVWCFGTCADHSLKTTAKLIL